MIAAAKPWTHVLIAGTKAGTTRLKCLELPSGTHTIDLENPALGSAKDVELKVKSGETVRVTEPM